MKSINEKGNKTVTIATFSIIFGWYLDQQKKYFICFLFDFNATQETIYFTETTE